MKHIKVTLAFHVSKFFPSIKIHCWGGFGSQLFALVALLQYESLYPNRRFILIFHSAGVTRRVPEIPKSILGRDYLFVDDFLESEFHGEAKSSRNVSTASIKKSFRSTLKTFLTKLGYIKYFDKDRDIRLRYLARHIIGHYTEFNFDTQFF